MPVNPPADTPRMTPHLFYDDVGAATDWLVHAFGFKIRLKMTDPNGLVVHSDLEVGDAMVMLGLTEENAAWECPRTLGGKISQRLYIYVDDVDATVTAAHDANVPIVLEPVDQPWGERIAYVADPDGNLVMLCAPRQ